MSKPDYFLQEIEGFFSGKPLNGLPVNDVFCIMPWVHFHVTQYGSVAPCCVSPWGFDTAFGNINTQSIEEIWNSPAMREFRLKQLKAEPDKRCERCYTLEKGGAFSLRQTINSLYARHSARLKETKEDGSLPSHIKPVYLDIRFSNKCNFKCRICGPHASSAWYEEAVKLGMPVKEPLTRSINNLQLFLTELKPWLNDLEEIYFAGGEPLFLDEHYVFLDELLKAGKDNVLLRYNTNFSSLDYEKGKAFQYWKSFKKVLINASLDDMGERGELQRKGQNWEKVEENIQKLKSEVPHAHFMVAPTVSALNIWTLCDMHRYFYEKGYIEVDDFIPTMLEQPEYYSVKVLPLQQKQALAEKLKAHAQWIRAQNSGHFKVRNWVAHVFATMPDYMLSEDRTDLLPELLEATKKLDSLRRESAFDVIPELKEIFSFNV